MSDLMSILGSDFLSQPGDSLTLKVTKKNRKVATLIRGNVKESLTCYPNNTTHYTKTITGK